MAGEAEAEAGAGAGQCDAVLLAPLTEDTFLHNLHVRFKRDFIYTYVGNALVSVNPGRALPLYSPDLVRTYLARPPHQLPPHLYAITAAAYRWVRDRNESQCIVITGESGAGKTEAARVCLQCVVLAGAEAGAGAGAGAALTAAGTLLEAFGNAATARNHNASRFGKLLEVELDVRGAPAAARLTHYMLEKSRVCGVWEGERNFHVLYQLLAGAEPHLLKRLKLQRSWEQYRVLRPALPPPAAPPRHHPATPPGAGRAPSDAAHFAFTKGAMIALGLSAAECGGVLRALAFLLKLGNLRFEPATTLDGSLAPRPTRHYELEEACALVGVSRAELSAALLGAPPPAPAPTPGHHEGAPSAGEEGDTDAELDTDTEGAGSAGDEEEGCAAWAGARRDRLLAALYARLFAWLVAAVNTRLEGGWGGRRSALGILDMYGLESLAHNGLERLLINYAAERVQLWAGAAALRHEQEEYAREGLAYTPLSLPALHHPAADLLDHGAGSVLGVLRDVWSRGAGDAAIVQGLHRLTHPRLRIMHPHHFQVVHFGGAVMYSARGMADKNRDGVCARAHRAMSRARDPLLCALFPAGGPGAGGSPRRAGGGGPLSCRQRAVVGALVRRLEGCAPRLVRCLRADAALRPHRFDAPLLRHQLRTQGIMEMALVRRAGWCEAWGARALLQRYGVLGAGGARAGAAGGEVRAARALLRALPIPSAEFAYGRSKVFVRSPRTVWELEALRGARVSALVSAAQRAWRRHRARRRARAQAVIARAWRAYRAGRGGGAGGCGAEARAAGVVWRAWSVSARRGYLRGLWARLPARHMSPLCAAWPACPYPRLVGGADAALRRVHHAWRCRVYRARFDQTARNRMREKVTASVLFRERKALYARSVPHPFVGDYVRLRASAAWRRGAAGGGDRYVVFADVARKVSRAGGGEAACLVVVSTRALLVLDARSLRLKRRVAAHRIHRLSLSPLADDLLAVHVHACGAGCDAESGDAVWGAEGWGGGDEGVACAPGGAGGGCLWGAGGGAGEGDLLLRTTHVLELATKLFLVVQNAAAAPPLVDIATQFEVNLGGGHAVTVTFHVDGGGGCAGARLVRRGSRIDVLL